MAVVSVELMVEIRFSARSAYFILGTQGRVLIEKVCIGA